MLLLRIKDFITSVKSIDGGKTKEIADLLQGPNGVQTELAGVTKIMKEVAASMTGGGSSGGGGGGTVDLSKAAGFN